ncbi:MAG: HlyD family efflux transporter periplasmic adaptor subunit [Ignavibacteriales bacterium]
MQDEFKRRRKAKAKPVRKIKLVRLIIVLAGLFYFVMFINAFFGQEVKTYVVNYGKIEEADNTYGIIVRDEKIISQGESGILKPVKAEGDRIGKGTIVASVFNDSANQAEKKIADIDDRIQRAIRENENNSNYAKLNFSGDIKKIDVDTELKIFELSRIDREKEFEKVNQIKEAINENIRKKAQVSGEFGQANQYIRNMINEKKSLQNDMMKMKHNVISGYAGVVSYCSDGFESILVPETIKNLNISRLEELGKQIESRKAEIKQTVRVVDNFKCYVCTVINNKERIAKIKAGNNAWLRFSAGDEELIPAVVYNISVEKDGRALVVFSITNNVESLINYRKVNLDIVWTSSKGLKVPLSSIKKAKFLKANFKDKENIDEVREGDKVQIKFLGYEQKPISGNVYDISKSDEEGYDIEFILSKDVQWLLNGKEVNLQINWQGVKNINISHNVTGICLEKEGVMAANTSYAEFQEVKVIKRDNEYAIVNETASMFNKGITLYEEILLNASNVQEGRQIRRWEL